MPDQTTSLLATIIDDERARVWAKDVVVINIRFPVEMHERLKHISTKESISLNGFVIASLRHILKSGETK